MTLGFPSCLTLLGILGLAHALGAQHRINSPIWRISQVHTPLMLVHGEDDFIPIQQAEEVFTALYRQDKRVRFVRYTGEEHTISARANVLDLWQRLGTWLSETMRLVQGDTNQPRRTQSDAARQ